MKKDYFQLFLFIFFIAQTSTAQWVPVLDEDFNYGASCTDFEDSCNAPWCNSHGQPDIYIGGSCQGGNSAEMLALKDGITGLEQSQGIVYDFGSYLEYGHYRVSFCYCIKEYYATTADLGLTAKLLQVGPSCPANAPVFEELPNIIFSPQTTLYDDVIDPSQGDCHNNTWYAVVEHEFEITQDHRYLWIYPKFDPNNSDGVNSDICLSNFLLERNDTPCQAKIEIEDCLEEHCVYGLSGETSTPSYNESIVAYDWTITSGGTTFPAPPSEPNILFSPELNGNYEICLKITDSKECKSEVCVEIAVDCFEESTCERPQNPNCVFVIGGQMYFVWDQVPGAQGYEFKWTTNTSSCGCGSGTGFTSIDYTTSNSLPLSAFQEDKCFTWQVRADCGNGVFSGWSTEKCYDDFTCSDPVKIVNDKPGQKPVKKPELSSWVFPNPTSGELNLELKAPGKLEVSVEIFDVNGRRIKALPATTFADGLYKANLNVNHSFSPGLHHVLFKTNYGDFSEKVMIVNEK